MEWIAAMQQAITYMEEHLMEEINYEDVAKHVHTSNYEFHRAFSFLTGMTANTYIRNRRLSLAGKEIVENDAKITDIALKYGYETPESFTKAFTRFRGVAPKYAREESATGGQEGFVWLMFSDESRHGYIRIWNWCFDR